MSLVKRAPVPKAIVNFLIGNELDRAKIVRRARKGLGKLAAICDDAGVPINHTSSVLNVDLRDKELELFKQHIAKLSPDDIMNSIAIIKTFSIE